MQLQRLASADSDAFLIARSNAAAARWEAALGAPGEESGGAGGEAVWPSRRLSGFGRWLAERWQGAAGAAGAARCLLGGHQTERLWQRVIDESPEGEQLISTAGVAAWARAARRTLLEHGCDPSVESGPAWQGDSAAFLRFNRRFEDALEAAGWIDAESLLYRLNREPACLAPERGLILLDPPPATPERERLVSTWQAAGFEARAVYPDGFQANCARRLASDPAAEIGLIAEWAADRLGEEPGRPLAVVVPDLARRLDEIETTLGERLGPATISHRRGHPLEAIGIFGAAVSALRLLASDGSFAAASRWLRSPFFADEEGEAAARLDFERRLRADPRGQQGFAEAWRRHGLRGELARRAPATAARLDRALERLPRRATPTGWSEAWQSSLQALGWRGFDAELPAPMRQAWDDAWGAFAELTAVTGTLDLPAALAGFERVLAARSVHSPVSLHGIELLERIDEVGPGFAGVWVAGFSDSVWPEPPPQNPFIPFPLGARLNLPGARPEATLAAAQDTLRRLLERVPEAIFSCPVRVLDEPQVPNPVFADWPEAAEAPASPGRLAGYAAGRLGARQWETLPDPAPPFAGGRIPGGPRTLDLQSACPLRAFCDARLGTRALEVPVRGIDPRLRGILLHRVLELASTGAAAAIAQACAELIPPGDASWQRLVAAEQRRLRAVLDAFLAREAERPAFVTVAVERRVAIELAGHTLAGRMDREDRLESGGRLLIDYKTGRRPITGWFRERLGDCQLPLYAQHGAADVAGIAVVTLADEGVAYRAAGTCAAELPGRQRPLAAGDWQDQLERWREQLQTLVGEFAAGDVRLPTDGAALADGPYAALTRIRELRR